MEEAKPTGEAAPIICYLCHQTIIDPADLAWKNGFSGKHPFHHACVDRPWPDLPIDDDTPAIVEQAEQAGWEAAYYNFGKGDDGSRHFFNPSIVRRNDGYWLLARVAEQTEEPYGRNSVYAFQLDETGKVPKVGYRLLWPESMPDEHHEDPRACFFPQLNQTVVCATNFKWHGYTKTPAWTGALQTLGFFDSEWQCKIKHRPPIGGNPSTLTDIEVARYEKSWIPFFHENKLHIFYKPDPWEIYEFGQTWDEVKLHKASAATWAYGIIRNGTSPVLVGDEYLMFFHSSLPWKSNLRRYYMGAITFEARPPFTLLRMTREPLLRGSQKDIWQQRKPPCVFPCGAVFEGDKWLVSMGVNDLAAAWVEIPHQALLGRLYAPGERGRLIFPPVEASGVSEEDTSLL